jgi:ankyrin repeat protein
MTSRLTKTLVLSCIETLDFSYLSWFSMTTKNGRWGPRTEEALRQEWGVRRCLSFVFQIGKMPKLRFLDLSGLCVANPGELDRVVQLLGASSISTLKFRSSDLTNDHLRAMLNHPSGALSSALRILDICHCRKLSPEAASIIGASCPNLEELMWFMQNNLQQEFKEHFIALLKGCPKLRKFVAPNFRSTHLFQSDRRSRILKGDNSFCPEGIWRDDLSWMDEIKSKFDLLGVSADRKWIGSSNTPGYEEVLRFAAPHVRRLDQIMLPTGGNRNDANYTPLMGTFPEIALLQYNRATNNSVAELVPKRTQELKLEESKYDINGGELPFLMNVLMLHPWQEDLVRFALEMGAHPFAPAANGLNAITVGVTQNSIHLQLMLEHVKSDLFRDHAGREVFPRHYANYNQLGLNLLLSFSIWGRSPHHSRILDPDCLLKFQIDVNAQDMFGFTALHYAVLGNSLKSTRGLLKLGAVRNSRSIYGNRDTPCKLAVRCGCGRRLLERLLLPELLEEWALNEPHWAFSAALLMNNRKMLDKLILNRYSDESARRRIVCDAEEVFPIVVAAVRSSDSLLGHLLKHVPYIFECVDIKKEYDTRGLIPVRSGTALHVAVAQNRPQTARLLVEAGANVGACDAMQRTALLLGIQRKNCLELVPLLLEYMAKQDPESINRADRRQHTALHWAVALPGSRAASIGRALLKFPGIDAQAKDKRGRTAGRMRMAKEWSDLLDEFA